MSSDIAFSLKNEVFVVNEEPATGEHGHMVFSSELIYNRLKLF